MIYHVSDQQMFDKRMDEMLRQYFETLLILLSQLHSWINIHKDEQRHLSHVASRVTLITLWSNFPSFQMSTNYW